MWKMSWTDGNFSKSSNKTCCFFHSFLLSCNCFSLTSTKQIRVHNVKFNFIFSNRPKKFVFTSSVYNSFNLSHLFWSRVAQAWRHRSHTRPQWRKNPCVGVTCERFLVLKRFFVYFFVGNKVSCRIFIFVCGVTFY